MTQGQLGFGDVVGLAKEGPQLRFSCAGAEAEAESDRVLAASAYEAMLKVAPNLASVRQRLDALGSGVSAGG